MLNRQHGTIFFECDGCGDILFTEQKTFDEARDVFTLEGWRSMADGETGKKIWLHYCPDCSKEFV